MAGIVHRNPHAAAMLDCYQQSGAWADGSCLIKHEREKKAAYDRRRRLFVSPALYTYLLDGYGALWGTEPARTGTSDGIYSEHFAYSSGQGKPLSSLLRTALVRAQITGASFLVMDSFAEQGQSWEDMLVQRSYPFLEVVDACDVVDLVIDRTGTIQRFGYTYTLNGERYERTYTPYRCSDTGKPGELKTWDLPVRMPVVPISPVHPLISGETPPSPTLSLYQCQQAIVNTLSLVTEEFCQTTFPLLVINASKAPQKSAELGVSNGLHLQPGEAAAYLSPASSTVDSKMAYVDKMIAMMIRTQLNLLSSGEQQSGVAKELDRSQNLAGLRALAVYMEKAEYAIYELFCGFIGAVPSPEYKVRYSKAFAVDDVAAWLANALDVLNVDMSDDTKKAIRQEIVTRLFGDDEMLSARLMQAEEQHSPSAPAEVDSVAGV